MTRKSLVTLSILLLPLISGTVSIAQKRGEVQIVDVAHAYENGRYDVAVGAATKILASEPDNDAAWYYRGLGNMSLGNGEEARSDIIKAISLDSTNYWYREAMARMYAAAGQIELSIEEYENIIRKFPDKRDTYYSLVSLYVSDNRLDKAIEAIDEIEASAGKSDPTVVTKYHILLRQDRQEEAHELLEDYCDEYASPQVLSMLGDYEMGIYNDSTALAYYNEALSLDRDYGPAIIGKVEVYRMTRKYPAFFNELQNTMANATLEGIAKSDYLRALIQHSDQRFLQTFKSQLDSVFTITMDCHPTDSSVIQISAMYYCLTGRNEIARTLFRINAENYPDDPGKLSDYLQILYYIKEWDILATEAEKAFRKFPGDPYLIDVANSAHYQLKEYGKIISNYELLLLMFPEDTSVTLQAYAGMGDMYYLLGDRAKAYKSYDKALKINPDYAPVLNNYAYYLSLENRSLGRAYKMSKRTVEQEPDNATYLDTFGWILHLQGKDLEAKAFFKHAMLYGGKESATILEHYAAVLDVLGETDLAKVYRLQASAKDKEAE